MMCLKYIYLFASITLLVSLASGMNSVNIKSFSVSPNPVYIGKTLTIKCVLASAGDAVIRVQGQNYNIRMCELKQTVNPKCKSHYPDYYKITGCSDTSIAVEMEADWDQRDFSCASGFQTSQYKSIHLDVFTIGREVDVVSFSVSPNPVFTGEPLTIKCVLASPGDAVIRAQKNARMCELNQSFTPKCKSHYPDHYKITDCTDTSIAVVVDADWNKRGNVVCRSGFQKSQYKSLPLDVFTTPNMSVGIALTTGTNKCVLAYNVCTYPTPTLQYCLKGSTCSGTDIITATNFVTDGTNCIAFQNETKFTVDTSCDKIYQYRIITGNGINIRTSDWGLISTKKK